MQQLLGDKAGATDGSFIRELFLQRLPANVRMVLASAGDTVSLEELAQLADKVVEVAAPSISAMSAPQLTAEVAQLRAEVTHLRELVKSLSSRGRSFRTRSPSPAQTGTPTNAPLCWYHLRFGDAAQKCRAPCSKSGNDLASR